MSFRLAWDTFFSPDPISKIKGKKASAITQRVKKWGTRDLSPQNPHGGRREPTPVLWQPHLCGRLCTHSTSTRLTHSFYRGSQREGTNNWFKKATVFVYFEMHISVLNYDVMQSLGIFVDLIWSASQWTAIDPFFLLKLLLQLSCS